MNCLWSMKKALSGEKPNQLRCSGQSASRPGFSALELVCVLVILGVLLALLLPAVQSVREDSRKTACQNRLRQLGLAVTSHESQYRRFPPGSLGYAVDVLVDVNEWEVNLANPAHPWYLPRNQNTSWLVFLLPWIEQETLADQLPKTCFDTVHSSWEEFPSAIGILASSAVRKVMATRVPAFLCPSDISPPERLVFAMGSQPAFDPARRLDVYLITPVLIDGEQPPYEVTSFSACSGAYSGGYFPDSAVARYRGVFASRPGTLHAAITDGLSNTILAGETLGEIEAKKRLRQSSWMFGQLCRARGDLPWMQTADPFHLGYELLGDEWFSSHASFGSFHPGGVNCLRADGSVTAISRYPALEVWYSLCGMADAESR